MTRVDRRRNALSWVLILSLGLWVSVSMAVIPAGTLFSGQFGSYRYSYYVPVHHQPQVSLPLLVVLHGCKQDAHEMIKGTGFNTLADQRRFFVLYPETHGAMDNPFGCWIWWNPDHQRRDGGAPKAIVEMIEFLKQRLSIDADRVYATGLSSGGAMSAILGSLYPDVFAAVAVHSGLAYGAAYSSACGLKVMRNGGVDPEGQGELAYHHQGNTHRVVPLIVFQGMDDDTVSKRHADQLIAQFAQMNDFADDGDGDNDSFDDSADGSDSIPGSAHYPYSVYHYEDQDEVVAMQKVLVDGLGHAWSGGSSTGSYTDPNGPPASNMIWAFFKRWSLTKPAPVKRLSIPCEERLRANHLHFWWHHTMGLKEYACDPWRVSWRHGFDDVWGGGRCP